MCVCVNYVLWIGVQFPRVQISLNRRNEKKNYYLCGKKAGIQHIPTTKGFSFQCTHLSVAYVVDAEPASVRFMHAKKIIFYVPIIIMTANMNTQRWEQ